MRRAGRAGALLVGAFVLSACGSTVQYAGSLPVGGGAGQSSSNADGGLGPPGATDAGPATGRVGSSGAAQREPGQPGQRGASSTLPTTPVRGLGPGVTDRAIRIGFSIQDNNATVSSLAATYNVQLPDSRGAYQALVAYVNAHGGVGGRKLLPVYHSYDPTSGNADQIGQAACAAFTEDASVFAALDTPSGSSTYNTCMQQRGRLMLQSGLYFGSEPTWRRYSNEVAGDGLPLDAGGSLLARHLVGTGFLSRSTKVGAVVRSSDDLQYAFQHGFVPALRAFGLGVTQAQYVQDPQDSSELSGYTADISSAVLKFQSSGIDRVVFFDVGSYAALVFAQTADKQQYHPRYGFSSMNSVVALSGSGTRAPEGQLDGAEGVSWVPAADGLPAELTPNGRLCLAILKDAGITPSDAGTRGSYLQTCQAFFLFRAAAEAAGRNLNRETFLHSVERLGSTFVGTNTWDGMTRFTTDHHSGVSVYRPYAYDRACACFRLTGSVRSVHTP